MGGALNAVGVGLGRNLDRQGCRPSRSAVRSAPVQRTPGALGEAAQPFALAGLGAPERYR